jgi:hypothetical protein
VCASVRRGAVETGRRACWFQAAARACLADGLAQQRQQLVAVSAERLHAAHGQQLRKEERESGGATRARRFLGCARRVRRIRCKNTRQRRVPHAWRAFRSQRATHAATCCAPGVRVAPQQPAARRCSGARRARARARASPTRFRRQQQRACFSSTVLRWCSVSVSAVIVGSSPRGAARVRCGVSHRAKKRRPVCVQEGGGVAAPLAAMAPGRAHGDATRRASRGARRAARLRGNADDAANARRHGR